MSGNAGEKVFYSTPMKKSQLFQSDVIHNSVPHERLYADNKKNQERRRVHEVVQSQKRNEKCPFKPQKHSTLEFQYLNDFKDSGTRLYNNYFETQDKLDMAKKDRDRELRSMSETRTAPNINVSITNNYISSINLDSKGRSSKNSK